MKKKAIIISIPFIVIAAVVVYFFVRYSSVERSIYLKNLKYRFDWKLECARESDYSEKRDFDFDYYIRFTEVGTPNTELDTISEIKDRCINVLSQTKYAGMKTHLIFVSTSQGEYLSLFIDEKGQVYEITCESNSMESKYYHSEDELEKTFPGSEIELK